MAIKQRGKWLSLYKRVPKRYASVEPRKFVWVALKTDSQSVAQQKAGPVWEQMIAAWEAKLAGDTDDAEQRFDAARDLAEARGFRYMRADILADALPIKEIAERFKVIEKPDGSADLTEAAAVLGGAPEPQITVTKALDMYWGFAADKTIEKSEDQLRRWKNPRIKAVRNFVDVVGDKAISGITCDDMLDFRNWWMERLEIEGMTPNSANKDLIHLGDILKTVNRMKRLNLELPVSGFGFKEKEAKHRPPFADDWIKSKIMAPGALDGLNSDARCIILAMVNTGARPSELAALTADQIKLDAKVPHISIEPIGRQLKSANARRVIPLCGVSLAAMKVCPEGFARYRDTPAGLSATINKYLRTNGLLETPEHSLYSLRHSFEDRQLAAGVDERIRRDLMGHSLNRERYGKGASLEQLHGIIQATAL